MIRHMDNHSESWKNLPWKQFRRNLFRLQKRIYKAIQVGDKRKAKSLMKLVLKSTAARLLAVRQVTQLNAGKKTAGIDGKASLSLEERFAMSEELKQPIDTWKHNPLREIPIPKKDGKTRILKVPTIRDRAWQCLVKYALEPAHEATSHARSYGFRTGRAAQDAQKHLFDNLNSRVNGIEKRVIELDIEKCFDRISHKSIMERLIAPSGIKLGIFRCLKAGVNPEFPEQGTPQGGVVSPLLANIALNGIEEIHQSVRYADDMVIILKPQDEAEVILGKISQFLAERGMKVSEKKTKLTATTDGFDFLGWNFRVQKNGKFRCVPSVDNFKAFRQKIKHIVNNSNYGATVKAEKLAPVVRGWRNYHRYCKMDGSRNSLYHIETRAFRVFNKESKQNRDSSKRLLDKAFPAVSYSENKYIKVKGEKSPFDGDIIYWSERNSKLYDGATSQALKRQDHSCGYCGLKLLSDEKVHLHHVDGNHSNWERNNLLAIHESCHDYIHMSKSSSQEHRKLGAGKPARPDLTGRGGEQYPPSTQPRQRNEHALEKARNVCKSNDLVAYVSEAGRSPDLRIRNMVKCHNRAKSISDASWYQFRVWLEHFAKKFGKKAIAVPPHNTSQECCICGKKVQKELKVRIHFCTCGLRIHRDINAAINILLKAKSTVGQTGSNA